MSVKNYYSVDGEIMGDSVAGDYMRDALGNVTGTCDHDTGAVRNTYRYKPSGELLSKTGNFPDPKFMHVGTQGVRNTALPHSEEYMRARHYSSKEGRFTTVDPLWPNEHAYGYVAGNPVSRIDPFGLQVMPDIRKPLPVDSVACNKFWNEYIYRYCNNCYRQPYDSCQWHCNELANRYYRICGKPPTRDPMPFFGPPRGGGPVAPRPRPIPLFPKLFPPCTPQQNYDRCVDNCYYQYDLCKAKIQDWLNENGLGPGPGGAFEGMPCPFQEPRLCIAFGFIPAALGITFCNYDFLFCIAGCGADFQTEVDGPPFRGGGGGGGGSGLPLK